ncbi:helix-turn-helix domain-containing protein [Thalassoglobus sp. JC818]|uniref:helix-turn-helix transcriptional regulator n=1 Tax=Thalassoglobus sp. JC818 TaxID=3232136 RepID=UPI00345881A8
MQSTINSPAKLTRAAAADYLGVTKSTLATWASLGKGPVFRKIGGKVIYLVSDLDSYMDARATNCSSALS